MSRKSGTFTTTTSSLLSRRYRQGDATVDERSHIIPKVGGGASVTRGMDSASSEPRQRTAMSDLHAGRYGSLARVRALPATPMPRQYPLMPVVDTFLESQSNPHMTQQVSEMALGESGLQRQHITLSSRLPPKVWYILAKSLGIKLHATDRPIFATFLHILTLTAAFTFAIPGVWYTIYDIRSQFSKTTVLIGSVQIVIGFMWACMGVYAHKLAARLFGNKNFVECVRVHSKTFLKISTSWLTITLGVLVVGLNCYVSAPVFYDNSCGTALINSAVCKVFFIGKVAYAVLTLIWNFIVAYIMFSVCRTHTIGIRRFMRELALDAQVYEDYITERYSVSKDRSQSNPADQNNLGDSWFMWDDAINDIDPTDEDVTSQGIFLQSLEGAFSRRHSSAFQSHTSCTSQRSSASHHHDGVENSPVGDDWQRQSTDVQQGQHTGHHLSPGSFQEDDNVEQQSGHRSVDRNGEANVASSEEIVDANINSDPFDDGAEEGDEQKFLGSGQHGQVGPPGVLTNNDLLFTYWKFMRRLCVTSRFLQRWLASWIAFVIIWDGYFVIYWTSHPASLIGILEFLIPLVLLLLLCSAYAEVNAEGQRLLKTICPLEERLSVIMYCGEQPLSVKVFSITVTYNALMTVILGFSIAFASRMILDEISRN